MRTITMDEREADALATALEALAMRLRGVVEFKNGDGKVIAEVVAGPTWLDKLTRREREALGHLLAGMTIKGVAHAMGVNKKTAEKHKQSLHDKARVNCTASLVREALMAGFPVPPPVRTTVVDEATGEVLRGEGAAVTVTTVVDEETGQVLSERHEAGGQAGAPAPNGLRVKAEGGRLCGRTVRPSRGVMSPRAAQVLRHIVSTAANDRAGIARDLGVPLQTVLTACSEVKKATGCQWDDLPGLRAWAAAHADELARVRQAKPFGPRPRRAGSDERGMEGWRAPEVRPEFVPERLFAVEASNLRVEPVSQGGAAVGRTLNGSFTRMDLAARLDGDRDARAGQWLAAWAGARWVERAGPDLWRPTARFGVLAA